MTSFDQAAAFVANPANGTWTPTNDQKLRFYSLFKQATEGDCTAEAPSMIRYEAKAKWSAWNSVKGMGQEAAREAYVAELTKLVPKWM
ncbi:MAG: hypothetical protein KVP17_002846 [Porospora cf. gigantea B]|uniref:uncharacterized protein n=1 Tax=Porospora cf. gigantea B TaxID=2853592 RepID=UPI0035719C92|nr:MAG: hypothetical protein KVP17_002846 [Porospora cf. gigantea B]